MEKCYYFAGWGQHESQQVGLEREIDPSNSHINTSSLTSLGNHSTHHIIYSLVRTLLKLQGRVRTGKGERERGVMLTRVDFFVLGILWPMLTWITSTWFEQLLICFGRLHSLRCWLNCSRNFDHLWLQTWAMVWLHVDCGLWQNCRKDFGSVLTGFD